MSDSGAREMYVTVGYGDLEITIGATDVAWAPDVASDLSARALQTFATALDALVQTGIVVQYEEDEDTEEVEGEGVEGAT